MSSSDSLDYRLPCPSSQDSRDVKSRPHTCMAGCLHNDEVPQCTIAHCLRKGYFYTCFKRHLILYIECPSRNWHHVMTFDLTAVPEWHTLKKERLKKNLRIRRIDFDPFEIRTSSLTVWAIGIQTCFQRVFQFRGSYKAATDHIFSHHLGTTSKITHWRCPTTGPSLSRNSVGSFPSESLPG